MLSEWESPASANAWRVSAVHGTDARLESGVLGGVFFTEQSPLVCLDDVFVCVYADLPQKLRRFLADAPQLSAYLLEVGNSVFFKAHQLSDFLG